MDQNKFVGSKLALIDQEFELTEAEVNVAWMQVRNKLAVPCRPRKAAWIWPASAAAAIAITVAFHPAITAWAQDMWTRLTLRGVANIEIDLGSTTPNLLLPNVFPLYPQEESHVWRADSPAEASAMAGFDVKVLASLLVPPLSKLNVVTSPVIRHRFHSKPAEDDLRLKGRTLPAVPAGLEGGEIILEPQSRSVVSFYGTCRDLVGPGTACAFLTQSRLPALILPSGVLWEEYTRFSLELAGISRADAARLAGWSRAEPILFVPLEAKSEIRPVHVRNTEAQLTVYLAPAGGETAFALDWQENGFAYRLFGRGPENAIALAESMR